MLAVVSQESASGSFPLFRIRNGFSGRYGLLEAVETQQARYTNASTFKSRYWNFRENALSSEFTFRG